MSAKEINTSIVVPVYNEVEAIKDVLEELRSALDSSSEIIVVNDGSTDGTRRILAAIPGVRCIDHPRNMGYGAALKTGIKQAKGDVVITFDGDGQHDPADIPRLLEAISQADVAIGQRDKASAQGWLRRPGKFVLRVVANFLAGTTIPDLNCGLRAMRTGIIRAILDLLPDGFSFSTTSTIAFLKLGTKVAFVPVVTRSRLGHSTVRQLRHGSEVLLLVLRLIVLFSPLRIFINVAAILFAVGLLYQIEETIRRGLHIVNGALLLMIAALLVFLFGLIADQISGLRLDLVRRRLTQDI